MSAPGRSGITVTIAVVAGAGAIATAWLLLPGEAHAQAEAA